MPEKIAFDSAKPLYLSDGRSFAINQIPQILDELRASGRPIIVFIHGRGSEPTKSLRGGGFLVNSYVKGELRERRPQARIAIPGTSADVYSNWDSERKHGPLNLDFADRSRPLSNIPSATIAFGQTLARIAVYRNQHAGRSMTLLAHSMGTIVVQRCVETGAWPTTASGMFANVLLSESDADSQDHAVWLSKLGALENVYVTVNADDGTLRKATDQRPKGRWALGLEAVPPLAQNVRYIDLSKMGAAAGAPHDTHEIINKRTMGGQIHVCRFFTQVLHGDIPDLALGANVDQVKDDVTYRLKFERAPVSPCFAALGPDD
jgi:hypothetical protein